MQEITKERVAEIITECMQPLSGVLRNPVDTTSIAMWLVPAGTNVPTGKDVYRHVSRTQLERVLAGLVDDGFVIKKTGADWTEYLGTKWWGCVPRAAYYLTPDSAEAHRAAIRERQHQKEVQIARYEAAQVLAGRYPEEFEKIVAELLAAQQK